MPTTIAPPDHDARNPLKDFLIFRVDETDGHPELADDSALEILSRDSLMHTLQKQVYNQEQLGILGYAEEGSAGSEVAVWVAEDELSVEYGGAYLARYEIECDPATGVSAVGKLWRIKGHTLFETSIISTQLRLFDLGEALGDEGWVKFLKLDEYAPRQVRHPDELQQILFSYTEAI